MRADITARLQEIARAESDYPLCEAAFLLAALDQPERDLSPYLKHLDQLASELGGVAASTAADRAEALSDLLHVEHGYVGDSDTYDDMLNADLMAVIDRRRGLPVALSILYIDVARRAGWPAWGLDFPGHFVIRIDGEGDRAIIDPFRGGTLLEPPMLRQLIKTYLGPDAELGPDSYEPMRDQAILLRLLNNIKGRAQQAGDDDRSLQIMARMLLVEPDDSRLWLESAAVQAQAGHLKGARESINTCLSLDMDPAERAQAELLLRSLQKGLN